MRRIRGVVDQVVILAVVSGALFLASGRADAQQSGSQIPPDYETQVGHLANEVVLPCFLFKSLMVDPSILMLRARVWGNPSDDTSLHVFAHGLMGVAFLASSMGAHALVGHATIDVIQRKANRSTTIAELDRFLKRGITHSAIFTAIGGFALVMAGILNMQSTDGYRFSIGTGLVFCSTVPALGLQILIVSAAARKRLQRCSNSSPQARLEAPIIVVPMGTGLAILW